MISKCGNYIPAIKKVIFSKVERVTNLPDAFMGSWQIVI